MNIFARQKSKARSSVWIVQNNLHIAETYAEGTRTKRDEHFAAELKLHTSFYGARPCVHKELVHDFCP